MDSLDDIRRRLLSLEDEYGRLDAEKVALKRRLRAVRDRMAAIAKASADGHDKLFRAFEESRGGDGLPDGTEGEAV
jgi:predicted  nucleic acid-binding Zn-ribbon protein